MVEDQSGSTLELVPEDPPDDAEPIEDYVKMDPMIDEEP